MFQSLPLLLAGLFVAPAALAQTANVGVDATQTVRTVDERVFGLNAVMWDGQTSSTQTVSMLQEAGVRAIRVPGGSLSDTYRWDLNKSFDNSTPPVLNTWTWSAGFGSFTRLITGINSQAFVTVNYGTGTPEEAAAWVAYANASSSLLGTGADVTLGVDSNNVDWKTAGYWSALRAAAPLAQDDGSNFLRVSRSAPLGLKYWEIGNECYGSWEEDKHTAKWDPVTYATAARDYLAKMRAVDPTIKIGVVVESGEDNLDAQSPVHNVTNPRTGVSHHGWTPVMLATLKSLPATPDFAIYHRYEQAPGAESDSGLLQAAKTWPNDAANLRQMITDYLGTAGAGVELCVTENNSVYSNPGKQTTSLVDGLYLADSIGNIMQTEFNSLVWWALRNGQDNTNNLSSSLYGWRPYGDYGVLSTPSSFGSGTYYDAYPTYYVMKLLSNFARGGDTVVKATSDNTLLSVFADKHSDGSLRLLVINKSPTSTIAGNIALTGFTPTSAATVYSYGMAQDNAAHTGTGSTDVASTSAGIAGASFSMQFAPYSASVVVLSDANQVQVINSISYNSTTFPAATAPGVVVTFTYSVTNTGTNAWGPNHYLVLRDSNDGNLAFASLDGVGPGASTTATLHLTAPTTPGHYTYYVQGLENNVAYFSTRATLTLDVGSFVGDFNADGHTDLLWENTAGVDRAIWYLNGTGIAGFDYLAGVANEWHIAGTADFNFDGQTDLLWEDTLTGDRSVWLMNGTSILDFPYLAWVDPSWHIAAVGDFNGDGKPDLLWENAESGGVDRAIWFLDGTNILGFGYLAGIPADWKIVGAGDFNSDGQTDIVWENTATGDRSIWLMNGTSILGFADLGNVALAWHIAMAADFDGDGQPDLLWENRTTGDRVFWIMNGTTHASSVYLAYVDPLWHIAP